MVKNKLLWVDNLKALCCILITLLHVIDGWLEPNNIILEQYSFRWYSDLFICQLIVRVAVPIFIMITGVLLLDKNKDFTFKKQIRYIKRMLLVLLIFGLFYCLIEEIVNNGLNNIPRTIFISILHLFENKSWGVMWYIYMLVGLYIITPIVKNFVNNCDNKTFTFTIIFLVILTTIVPTINYIFNIEISDLYLKNFIYVLYYLLGYYIYFVFPTINYKYKKIIMYLIGVIGYIGFSILLLNNYYYSSFSNNRLLFVAMISVFIFWLFSNNIIKIYDNIFVKILSKYSFGIYLVHVFWLNILYKGFHLYPSILPPVIGELLFLVVVTILSVISSMILYRLPVLKKILK